MDPLPLARDWVPPAAPLHALAPGGPIRARRAGLSGAALRDQVLRGAAVLKGLGGRRRDRVALVIPSCPQHVVAFHASPFLCPLRAGEVPLGALAPMGAMGIWSQEETHAMEHMEEPRHLDDQVREVSLEEAARQGWAQAAESPARHSAITLVKRDGLRVVLLVMAAGSEVPGHKVDAGLTLQVLKGSVRFRVAGEERFLARGHLFAVARGLGHDLLAIEETELLLTLGFAD